MEHLHSSLLPTTAVQMEHPSSYIPAAMWYNYSSYNDLLNRPRQLQNPVQPVTSAPMHMPQPTPSPVPDVTLQMAEAHHKGKKIRKRENWEGKPRNFRCNLCDTAFHTQYKLNTHMRIHSGVRPYVCDVCGRSFIQGSNLKAHKRVHTGERPYSCEECGKTFKASSHLVGHKRIHTGEKPYICGFCEEGFYTSTYLKNHISKHKGAKPYECKFCGETHATQYDLNMHKQTHTGDKPYKCRDCDLYYATYKDYRLHKKKMHGRAKKFKCLICDKKFKSPGFVAKHEGKCKGPREKRPKGRPRRKPRVEGDETREKRPKRKNNPKPAAPTDRISRSRTKALEPKVEEEIKEEPTYEEPSEVPYENIGGININELVKELGIEGFTKEDLAELPTEVIQTIPRESITHDLLRDLLEKQYQQKKALAVENSSSYHINGGSKISMVALHHQSPIQQNSNQLEAHHEVHHQVHHEVQHEAHHQSFSQHQQHQVMSDHQQQSFSQQQTLHHQPISNHQHIISGHQQQQILPGNQQMVTIQQQGTAIQQPTTTMSIHQPYISEGVSTSSSQLVYTSASQPYVVDLSNTPLNTIVTSNNAHFSRT